MKQSNFSYEELLHKQNYWPLQVIQDEFACAMDIPLRIYKKSAVVNLWEEESILRNNFSNQETFHNYVTAVATNPLENVQKLKDDEEKIWCSFFTEKRKKSCWLTSQSAGYFLIHSFQESALWCWWEFFFYYHRFIIDSNTYDTTAYYFDHFDCTEKHLHIAFKCLPLKQQKDCILVAGPVWNPIETIAGSDFEKQRVKPLVNDILLDFVSHDNDITTRKPALVRMGNSRFPMNSEYLYQQLERVVDSLKPILTTSLPVDCEMHRCDHVKLAEWALFTLQIDKILSCEILEKLKDSNKVIYARLDHPEILKTGEKMVPPWVKTQWNYSDNQNKLIPKFHIQYEEPNKHNRIENLHIELPQDFDASCKKMIENSFTTFLNRIFIRRSAKNTSGLLILRKWLNDRFRIVAQKRDTIKIYEWLCRWIADQVTADQVVLYYYNHGTCYIKKLGFYGKTDESEKWEDAILDYMKSVRENEQQRRNSICYRCVDKREVQFTRMFEPNTQKAIPNNEPILLPPKGIERAMQSAIATPIFVFGRVWGVLEINGFYPYQFCWNNKTFIEELASIFSPSFYQQHLLDRLQKLNKITVEEKTPQIYKDIAHQLAVIFLSHSATLWIIDQNCQYEYKYKCVGWYNRPDLEKELLTLGKDEWNNQIDTEIINSVTNDPENYFQSNYGKGPFNQHWIDSQPYEFQKLKIEHICIIPIYKLDRKTLMGSIFLYNQTNEGFDKRWQPKISLVKQHVTLLLEAVQIQQKKEKQHRDFIAHEIKRNAKFIEDRAINLLKEYVNHNVKFNPDQEHRLHNLTHDLKVHTQDLLHDIKMFSSDDYKRREHEHPLIAKAIATLCEPKQFLNFREQFNIAARSYWEIQKIKKFKIHYGYTGFSAEQEIYVEMQAYNFRQILGNLLDNAVKYNSSDNSIEAELRLKKYELEFIITNRYPCLKEGEEFRLFEEGFRGIGAKNVAGEGKGLFIVKQICDLYNLDFQYKAKPDPYIHASCLHQFILSFPPKLFKVVNKGENA